MREQGWTEVYTSHGDALGARIRRERQGGVPHAHVHAHVASTRARLARRRVEMCWSDQPVAQAAVLEAPSVVRRESVSSMMSACTWCLRVLVRIESNTFVYIGV